MQLVVMALLPGEEIGEEIHPYISQFIRIESGTGIAIINGLKLNLQDDEESKKFNIIFSMPYFIFEFLLMCKPIKARLLFLYFKIGKVIF